MIRQYLLTSFICRTDARKASTLLGAVRAGARMIGVDDAGGRAP
jgi:hypothetical protein